MASGRTRSVRAAATAAGFLVTILLLFASPALAHKPLDASNNDDLVSAQEIPDHRVSWAIYEELGSGAEAKYYKFSALAGERFFGEVYVPQLDRLEGFAPSMALAGRGLEGADLQGENYAVVNNAGLPFPVPDGMGALVFDYEGPTPSEKFYEEFAQTTYWQKQRVVIENLPTSGTYYLVVFDESSEGKYSLAVGEVEDFSAIDFVTILPAAWFEVKLFFEDYLSIAAAISVLVAIVALPTIYVLHKKKKRLPSMT